MKLTILMVGLLIALVKDSLAAEDDTKENIETKDEKTEEEIMKALGDKTIDEIMKAMGAEKNKTLDSNKTFEPKEKGKTYLIEMKNRTDFLIETIKNGNDKDFDKKDSMKDPVKVSFVGAVSLDCG